MLRSLIRFLLPTRLQDELRLRRAVARIEDRLRQQRGARVRRPHGGPVPLFVTLTSYPRRFRTLHLTLETLLQQSIVPDGILLWIARRDLRKLPRKVRSLAGRGVRIRACDDLGSYKKLAFALQEYPTSILVTADDDVGYPPDWLETLVQGANSDEPVVICHRAHRVVLDARGGIAPYKSWDLDVQDEAARRPSTDLLPAGVGGVLYPPGCFVDEVTDCSTFMRLSPDADDLWFYWMARLAGTRHKKVGGKFPRECWPDSQRERLYDINRGGGNDRQARALFEAYGFPGLGEPPAAATRTTRSKRP